MLAFWSGFDSLALTWVRQFHCMRTFFDPNCSHVRSFLYNLRTYPRVRYPTERRTTWASLPIHPQQRTLTGSVHCSGMRPSSATIILSKLTPHIAVLFMLSRKLTLLIKINHMVLKRPASLSLCHGLASSNLRHLISIIDGCVLLDCESDPVCLSPGSVN